VVISCSPTYLCLKIAIRRRQVWPSHQETLTCGRSGNKHRVWRRDATKPGKKSHGGWDMSMRGVGWSGWAAEIGWVERGGPWRGAG
jgi:hypothetical protein